MSTPKVTPIQMLERALAALAALAALFLTFIIWRGVSAQQAMWPLPGLYFVELPAVAFATALAFLVGYRWTAPVAWAAAGFYFGFAVLGAWSVGFFYAPFAVIFVLLAVFVTRRQGGSVLRGLGVLLAAAVVQAALMLLLVHLL